MEFLVSVQTRLPPDMDEERRAELLAAEAAYAQGLLASGVINRIWRVPGRTASIGVWSSEDATVLHDHLVGLPLFRWLDITVTPLTTHPFEQSPGA